MKNTIKLKTFNTDNDISDIRTAAEILKSGGLVAIPTETVYGLAADAFNGEAVKNIFRAKGRPQDNPLIVHISDFEQIYSIAREVPDTAKALAEKFWPGPLTIILPKRAEIPDETSGGLDTVAVRMPSHPVANKIIALSCPLAAPSANISGFPSPTSFEHVEADMTGRADAICNGGDCDFGVESTVITLATEIPVLLRPGGVTLDELRQVLGRVDVSDAVLNPMKNDEAAESPGMKYKHYSPEAQLEIVRGNLFEFLAYTRDHEPEFDAVLCFEGEESLFPDKITVTFGRRDDSLSQAQRLFDALRELDEKGSKRVLARAPSRRDIGLAVCNRLYRAAAFRFINAITRPVVGLTGPTGAGKGYVSKELKRLGLYICDTDKIARELTSDGSPFLKILASAFGEDIIENGSLNRKLLADRAFSTKKNQLRLNSLMHPEIIRIAHERCMEALEEDDMTGAVIDAPLLFEAQGDKLCDTVISVVAPKEIRLERIMKRDGITREEAEKRMSVQHEDEFYTSEAEFVILNDGNESIRRSLRRFREKYLIQVI